MKKLFLYLLLPAIVAGMMISTCYSESAFAEDLWVEPQSLSNDKSLDDWYVNQVPVAFSFCTPENMLTIQSAKILFIPHKSKDVEYELRLSVAKSGEHRNAFQYAVDGQIAEYCQKDVIEEIDVTDFLDICFPI